MMGKLGVVFVISATKGNNETKGVLGGEECDGKREVCLGICRGFWVF